MANDLATLNTKLGVKLRDSGHAVWLSTEKDDLLSWATATLFHRGIRREVSQDITLVQDQSVYTLDAIKEVSRADLYDTDNQMMFPLLPGAWETTGDGWGAASVFVNRSYANAGYHLHVVGAAPFDLATNLPPDELVPVILAMATAEAIRRAMNDRAKFEKWLSLNQTQNVTVNELVLIQNEADAEAERLIRTLAQQQRPVPAKVR